MDRSGELNLEDVNEDYKVHAINSSRNYTILVYDLDTQILYYFEYDS